MLRLAGSDHAMTRDPAARTSAADSIHQSAGRAAQDSDTSTPRAAAIPHRTMTMAMAAAAPRIAPDQPRTMPR